MTRVWALAPLLLLLAGCDRDGANITWQDVAFTGCIIAGLVAGLWVFLHEMTR